MSLAEGQSGPGAANEALLESWSLSLHELRPRTVDLYVTEARRFAGWLRGHDRASQGDLVAVEKRDVLAWIADLQAAGLAPATIRSRWIALRNLYRWAADEEEVPDNPLAKVIVARGSPPAPAVVDQADLAAVLKACEGASFGARRDMAVIRTLVATGLRVSELVGLEQGDVDLKLRLAYVRDGKGGKARVVRFDAGTAAAIDRYRRVRARHRFARLPALWIGHRGAMTRKGVPELLARRAKQAGVGHIHPHQLRHTWSDRWLASGGNEGDLQRLGGWESAEIMRRYGEARAVDRALAAYDEVNPMRGL